MAFPVNQPYWRTNQAKWILFCTDFVGCVTSLVAILAVYARLVAPSQQPMWNFLLEPEVVLKQLMMGIAAGVVVRTLVLMARNTQKYHQHRLQLCLANRLLRSLLQVFVAAAPGTRGYLALGITSRSLFLESPGKALAVVLFHPLAFSMQAALFVLPLWCTLVLQLVTIASTLVWSQMLPCILQHAAAETKAPTHLVAAAEKLCATGQSWTSLVLNAAAAPDGMLPGVSRSVCEGVTAVQTLHIFCTLCCTFVLPTTAVLAIEVWLKAVYTSSTSTTVADSSSSSSHTNSSSSSSASSSTGVGSSSSPAMRESLPTGLLQDHVFHSVLLAPVVLAITWLLAELLAGAFTARVDCPAVLHASGII